MDSFARRRPCFNYSPTQLLLEFEPLLPCSKLSLAGYEVAQKVLRKSVVLDMFLSLVKREQIIKLISSSQLIEVGRNSVLTTTQQNLAIFVARGECHGENAVLYPGQLYLRKERGFAIHAMEQCLLLKFELVTFINEKAFYMHRIRIKASPMMSLTQLGEDLLKRFAQNPIVCQERGTVLYKQGDFPDKFYLLDSGTINFRLVFSLQSQSIYSLVDRQCFGWQIFRRVNHNFNQLNVLPAKRAHQAIVDSREAKYFYVTKEQLNVLFADKFQKCYSFLMTVAQNYSNLARPLLPPVKAVETPQLKISKPALPKLPRIRKLRNSKPRVNIIELSFKSEDVVPEAIRKRAEQKQNDLIRNFKRRQQLSVDMGEPARISVKSEQSIHPMLVASSCPSQKVLERYIRIVAKDTELSRIRNEQ